MVTIDWGWSSSVWFVTVTVSFGIIVMVSWTDYKSVVRPVCIKTTTIRYAENLQLLSTRSSAEIYSGSVKRVTILELCENYFGWP